MQGARILLINAKIGLPLSGAKRKTFALSEVSGLTRSWDPEQTFPAQNNWSQFASLSAPFQDPDGCETMRCVVLTPGGDYETPGVHHSTLRRDSRVAARGARVTDVATSRVAMIIEGYSGVAGASSWGQPHDAHRRHRPLPPDVYARLVASVLSDILGQHTSGGRTCG